jgi:V8-like Glu-specific endopeptidase
MIRVPDFKIHDSNFLPVRPFGGVGRNISLFPDNTSAQGSDLLISPFVSLTAAHVITKQQGVNQNFDSSFIISYPGSIPNGSGGYNNFFGSLESEDSRYSDSYLSSNIKTSEDYGVIRGIIPMNFSFYSGLIIDTTNPRFVNVVGYPGNRIGMHEGFNVAEFDDFPCGFFDPALVYEIDASPGASGGPIFNSNETFSTGIHNSGCNNNDFGAGVSFNQRNALEIQSWLWNPTGLMEIFSPLPNLSFNLVTIPPFDGTFMTFNRMSINGDIEHRANTFDNLIKWESNQDGFIGQGAVISADRLKAVLTSGSHRITAKIDSNGESGEKNIIIHVTRPDGQFTSPNFCVQNLNSPNSCSYNLSWAVTDTPEISVVHNETNNSDFATGNSGSKIFTIVNGSNTRFKLYPSNQKKILLDTLNTNTLAIKTPTGTLTSNGNVCSLQPTPINPHDGTLRDPKATPPGCGTQLSWSNVQWTSPSIYYRAVGSSIWQHLYQIPCNVSSGDICSGSINTDNINPELISLAGVDFKLLQFNNASSGQLSPIFRVTAHRYADIYEYDNGDITDFTDIATVGFPTDYVIGNTLSNAAVLGTVQHGHNFHSPAVYDSSTDIDTVQINTADFAAGTLLTVKVFNMAAGLDVGLALKCAGEFTQGIQVGQQGIFDFNIDPTQAIITDPLTGAKSMTFAVTKTSRQLASNINCLYNRVIINRSAGTPSESLTYSVLIDHPNNIGVPSLSSASSTCANNYCVRLLGGQFASDAVITVRENIAGSGVLKTYGGNDIYSRVPINGQERLQFPIRSISIQDKFNANGLCFKVHSAGKTSNEKCFVRPITAPQQSFMGKTVSSYQINTQDVEHRSYNVVGAGGTKLNIMGNSWKKIAYNYTVTSNTVLEFDFRSGQQQPEINGIGFIMNGASTFGGNRAWQVYGSQNFGDQSFHNYSGNSWKSYAIPIGHSFNGNVSDMVFIADEDAHVGQSVLFRNPRLFERLAPPIKGFLFDPLKSGHGIHVSQSSNGDYLLFFYSYDDNGLPEWYIATSTFVNNKLSGSLDKVSFNFATNGISQVSAGTFSLDYDSSAVNSNSNCNGVNRSLQLAVFNWSLAGQNGSWCMQALLKDAPGIPAQTASHSGTWYEPALNGWGISLQTQAQGANFTSFVIIYYYDGAGNGRWASGYDANATVNAYDYDMLHNAGYARTATATAVGESIGSFDLNFSGANRANLNIHYPRSPFGNWIRPNANMAQLTQ